jgi:hypothetical protein
MNKFYNSIKLTALVLAVVSLAGCKKDVDTIGISDSLANKTMLGIYTYTEIDSATMQVYKKECALKRDNDGNQTGYYRESKDGQGVPSDVTTPITWSAEMAPDNMSMLLKLTLEGGKTMDLVWADGIIKADGKNYEKSLSGLSDIDTQNSINDNLQNTAFEGSAYIYHEHLDTVPYLAWKTKVDRKSYLPEDTAAKKQEYLEQLLPFTDTIVWYLRTQVAEHTLGYVYLDTVISGEDTTYVPMNMVYVDPTPNTAGKHLITYLTSEIKKRVDQVNDRPSTAIYSAMSFKRVNGVNTAAYIYEYHEYSKEYYTDPTSPKATVYDSTYVFDAEDGWVTASFANAKKFDILLSGTETTLLYEEAGGVKKREENVMKMSAFGILSISGYDKNKGEATQADLKYTMTK